MSSNGRAGSSPAPGTFTARQTQLIIEFCRVCCIGLVSLGVGFQLVAVISGDSILQPHKPYLHHVKHKFSILIAVLPIALGAALFISTDLPKGWHKAGTSVESYVIEVDRTGGRAGGKAALIRSIEKEIDGYASIYQISQPGKFRNGRLRMRGYLRTEDVADWAGLWLRADEAGKEQALSFDNMFDRPVKGKTPWTRYEIVIDIPVNATSFSYGAILSGTGKVWMDDLEFEIVDNSVPTTGSGNDYALPEREPLNLGLEE